MASFSKSDKVTKQTTTKPRFRCEVDVVDSTANIYLYGDVGWEITPKILRDEIRDAGEVGDYLVHINSYGGDAFDGIAIHGILNDLKPPLTTHIDGVAASAASLIAMAGDEIRMAEGANLIIHNPFSFAGGDYRELRKVASKLEKLRSNYASIYAKRTGLNEDQVFDYMDDEEMFTAKEAVELGFADSIHDSEAEFQACYNSNRHKFTKPRPELAKLKKFLKSHREV